MSRGFALLVGLVVVMAGCHGSGGGGGSSETTGATSSGGDEGSDIDPSLSHGFVRLQFAGGADVFANTDTVIATLTYGACLSTFYTNNPDLLQYGMAGGPIFGHLAQGGEGWQDRLCAANTAEHVDCSIVWITQQFDATKDLTVTYRVDGALEDGTLLFGPIPTAATAGCGAPTVEISAGATVLGKNSDEIDLWHLDTFAPSEAMTNQDDPIVLSVVPAAG